MKYFFLIAIIVVFFSCKKEQNKEIIIEQPNIQKLPNHSEMSTLMLLMYEQNTKNKERIILGDSLGTFPEQFLEIHTAALTDSDDRTEGFKCYTNQFLNNQQLVFKSERNLLIDRHNNVVSSCIACHKESCTGPIPKIKKLYIK